MTLQFAPRYDVDGFELRGFGNVAIPFLLAGGAAVGTGVAAWLGQGGWSVGEYNNWMKTMDDTIRQWDALGWKYKCWNNAQLRKSWLDYWKRFSQHYSDQPRFTAYEVPFLPDSAELPARDLMKQLIHWGEILNKCGAPIAIKEFEQEKAKEEETAAKETDWGAVAKWGALGIGGLVVLNLVTGLRGAFK